MKTERQIIAYKNYFLDFMNTLDECVAKKVYYSLDMEANNNLTSIDAIMDAKFGEVGTPERESFRKEAYAYCMGQLIHDARKEEKITQQELASRLSTDKSYISKIEKGSIEPSVSTFFRIIDALGLRIEIFKPIY